ncbi:glucose-6-phosphate isomerase [Alkalibaculum sp. M08DMB]|uniref:Glucose-6-phosphate isomerase n=1 Tax=Alkalibaculum sporogenes TaxID=2655001 RepID=A0A6A7KAI6_9FIRM|nr:glucose-6-phosphate isomerase [Alkalibaculum sporogenes]MPW26569.1 glucose-6-phosphate isomerase [Alkalibaculum sporogenes]
MFDYSNSFISKHEIDNIIPNILLADNMLNCKEGPGSDFLGWLDYPNRLEQKEIQKVKDAALKIQGDSEILIIIGIGGSYLGSKAVISALTHSFYNEITTEQRKAPKIYFAGQNISPTYLKHLLDISENKDISINVISKSGTTTEPAIAFRFFRELLLKKYGKEEASKRIYVTTDAKQGALKKMAENEGYTSFVIPDDVGGRYSVHTPVGLLPIAAAGIDIDSFLQGAKDAIVEFNKKDITNPCYQYAAVRNILYNKGNLIEILVSYEPGLYYISEWWKQLFGESEGKDNKGIFPASVNFSTDLHSLGQIIQEGKRNLFETILNIENLEIDLSIPSDEYDLDGLNYLQGKGMNYVNEQACKGTLFAHLDGKVPNLMINLPDLSPYSIGKMIYFFEKACALSGYLLGVNPFDQPGVESYKKNMFGLLQKPGFEEIGEALLKR